MENYKVWELKPNGRQKSFYGKAVIFENHGKYFLQSYETIVASIDEYGIFRRHYNGFSATTMRHINAFLENFGKHETKKKDWESLEVVPLVCKVDFEHKMEVL